MKYFTDFEVFRSIYLSVLFGIFITGVFVASDSFCRMVKRIFALPADVFKLVHSFSLKRLKSFSAGDLKNAKNKKVNNVYDAIMFSIFGVLLVLHFYVTLDGIFRIYVLFVVIGTFVFLKKTIGSVLLIVFEKIFLYIYSVILFFSALIVLPMHKTVKFMTKIMYKRIEPIRQKHLLKKSKKIVNKKLAQIGKLMVTKDIYTGV